MKKGLKTLMMCCLCIIMGIVIGSESKSLMKNMFSDVNSSPEAVIKNYYKAYYAVDGEILEQCLSPDLNDLKRLEYFGARGSSLARKLINVYNEYLYYKQNPPTEGQDERYENIKNTENNIEKYGIVRAYIENEVQTIADDHEYYRQHYGKNPEDTIVDIKFLEEESDSKKDSDYIEMGVFITKNNKEEITHDDRRVVIQKKNNKYYILDI